MFIPRIIPVLLLNRSGLVKSVGFKNHKYIGDPINAVRLFNEYEADELVFLDINAGRENRSISLDIIKKIGEEANMPFSVGGGIRELKVIQNILKCGAEKVVLNTIAGEKPDFINIASKEFGSSTVMVCIDVKKTFSGTLSVLTMNGRNKMKYELKEYLKIIEEKGAGEIIIQSVDRDGTMAGYDMKLLSMVSDSVSIPVIALGGAGKLKDLQDAYCKTNVSAFAAGSIFVFHGSRNAVLINYPDKKEKRFLFQNEK